MRLIQSVVILLLVYINVNAQQPVIKILESGKHISIRGLSVVNDNILWASGSNGSVARSVDGGNSFTWLTVPGYEKRDFRDIEAFDEKTAIIMGVAEPAVILKTKDGGKSWKKVFEDTTKGMFLDAMDFSNENHGMLVGDPIHNKLFIAQTLDKGETWKVISPREGNSGIEAKQGEAFFASSGTNIKMLRYGYNHFVMVSGGRSSRIFHGSATDSLPIMQGKESTGANSIAVYKDRKAVVVGGDFARDSIAHHNCVLFNLDMRLPAKFSIPQTPPHGYRSCVIYLDENNLLTCGTSGIDMSRDGGKNWELISRESFHVCQKAKKGNAVFLAGGNGRIAKWIN